jgi:ribose-phosphate pyrophosphokinase
VNAVAPTQPILVTTRDYASLGAAIAQHLGIAAADATLTRKTFSDGETYLRFNEPVRDRHVILVGSTREERDLVEILALGWQAVRDGAHTLSIAIPYFGYSTMERAVKEGEIVRAKTNAVLFSTIPNPPGGKHIYLLDLHAEGIPHYFEGGANVVHLYAKSAILGMVRQLSGNELLVVGSADTGRAKWVESYARDLGVGVAVITKRRVGDGQTEVLTVGGAEIRGHTVLLYDDMIRSGSSILNAIRSYHEAGAARVIVATTHLVLQVSEGWRVLQHILESGVSDLVVTDSIAHTHEQVAGLPDGALRQRVHVASIAALFGQAIRTRGRVDQPIP